MTRLGEAPLWRWQTLPGIEFSGSTENFFCLVSIRILCFAEIWRIDVIVKTVDSRWAPASVNLSIYGLSCGLTVTSSYSSHRGHSWVHYSWSSGVSFLLSSCLPDAFSESSHYFPWQPFLQPFLLLFGNLILFFTIFLISSQNSLCFCPNRIVTFLWCRYTSGCFL